MTIPPKLVEIREIHRLYCHLTGMEISLAFDRERVWYEWLQRFTAKDLEDVVRYLKFKIEKGERNPGALRYRNLICQPDLFEEDLAMYKAERRNAKPPMTPKQRVIEQQRPIAAREEPNPQVTAKPVSFYIEQMRKAAS